jgi:hypothetical protein
MKEEFVALLFVFGISLTANVALLIAWWRSGRQVRLLEARAVAPAPPQDDRTERLERSVESLASQVDQLANGQEFLNRLVAERLIRSVSSGDRPITPH